MANNSTLLEIARRFQQTGADIDRLKTAEQDGAVASGTSFTPAGGIAATDVQAALEELAGDISALGSFLVGEVKIWTTNTAPTKWVFCAGQALSRTTYASLFAVIGTTFGIGDGSTTFNVPDLRGRFPLGNDDMGGSSAGRVAATEGNNLGQGSGAETHTLVTAEMPAHRHGINQSPATGSGHRTFDTRNNALGTWYNDPDGMALTGGGGAHNNMPPYQTMNYIIYAGA